MDNYGWDTHGISIIEKVNIRPIWDLDNISRIIFDNNTGCCWIGGNSDILGDFGWFRVGLDNNVIGFNNIIWDLTFTNINNISANSVPCKIDNLNHIETLQFIIDYLLDKISFLSKGEAILPFSIKPDHLDISTIYRCDARILLIFNQHGYFPSYINSIEESLNLIVTSSIKFIYVKSFFEINKLFNVCENVSIQNIILLIEQYLLLISAKFINANSINYNNVQLGLDLNYQSLKSIKFNDLIGVSSILNSPGRFISTNGIDQIYYTDILAMNSTCFCLETTIDKCIIQNELYDIKDSIINLNINLNNCVIDSEFVTYNDYSTFDNLKIVLDWLINNSSVDRQLKASEINICGFDDSFNVQESLFNLQNQFKTLLLSIPRKISAKNIIYNSNFGHVNLQDSLDYLFDELNISRIGHPGRIGDPGPPGITGDIGPVGEIGEIGEIGPPGQIGYRGIAGINGCPGIPGDYGPPGETGGTGGTGFSGKSGFIGCPGIVGDIGNTGGTGSPADNVTVPPGIDNHTPGPTGGTGGPGAPGSPGILIANGIIGGIGGIGGIGNTGGTGFGSTCILSPGGTGGTGGTGGIGADCIESCDNLLLNDFELCVGGGNN